MKKSKIRIPGYPDLEFDEYSEPIDLNEDPAKFLERLNREKEYDAKLEVVADGVARVAESAIRANRSQLFWDVGDVLLPYQERIRSKSQPVSKYEQLMVVLRRVKEKVGERLGNLPGIDRKSYGVPYLLKMIRVRQKFSRDDLEGADYPQVQELIHDYLSEQERRLLLERVKAGEFSSAQDVRALVKSKMQRPSRRPPASADAPAVEGSASDSTHTPR